MFCDNIVIAITYIAKANFSWLWLHEKFAYQWDNMVWYDPARFGQTDIHPSEAADQT